MSIGNNILLEIRYNVNMEKSRVAKYLERHYLRWINHQGAVRPQKEFAEYLGVEYTRFNRYYNGRRADMDYLTALAISKVLNDYELLDILGFARPEPDPFAGLPSWLADAVRAALVEVNETVNRSGDLTEAEAAALAKEILSRRLSDAEKANT